MRTNQLDCLFNSAVQFSNGSVDVGFTVISSAGLVLEPVALMLRQEDGTFCFVASRIASQKAIWRGRVRVLASGAARWLGIGY